MTTLADFTKIVEAKIQDPRVVQVYSSRGLSSSDLVTAIIDKFIPELSRLVPLLKVGDLNIAGTYYKKLNGNLTDWSESISVIKSLIFPFFGYTTQNEDPLPTEDYCVKKYVAGDDDRYLVLRGGALGFLNHTARVTYSIPHTISVLAFTLPDQYVDSFAKVVAGTYLKDSFSTAKLEAVDRSLGAETIAGTTAPEVTQRVADELLKAGWKGLGADNFQTHLPNLQRNWLAG